MGISEEWWVTSARHVLKEPYFAGNSPVSWCSSHNCGGQICWSRSLENLDVSPVLQQRSNLRTNRLLGVQLKLQGRSGTTTTGRGFEAGRSITKRGYDVANYDDNASLVCAWIHSKRICCAVVCGGGLTWGGDAVPVPWHVVIQGE